MKILKITTVLAISLVCAGQAFAAIEFEYHVERFSLSGSNYSYVDEFDNPGASSRDWDLQFGSVEYDGEHAVLTDPGTEINYPGFEQVTLNISSIYLSSYPGNGQDFAAESAWSNDYLPEAPGGFFGQYFSDARRDFFYTISLSNFSPEVTEAFGNYGEPGMLVSFSEVNYFGQRSAIQTYSIDPALITGDFVFRLAFDQDLEEISGQFSPDGGVSFLSPFDTVSSSGVGVHGLIGDPLELPATVPVPAAAWLFLSAGLGLIGATRARRA